MSILALMIVDLSIAKHQEIVYLGVTIKMKRT